MSERHVTKWKHLNWWKVPSLEKQHQNICWKQFAQFLTIYLHNPLTNLKIGQKQPVIEPCAIKNDWLKIWRLEGEEQFFSISKGIFGETIQRDLIKL